MKLHSSVGVFSVCVALAATVGQAPGASAKSEHHSNDRMAFHQVNLVSDLPGMAQLTDPAVRNPWGIAFGEDTPLWVANQFSTGPTSKVTVYAGANGQDPISKVILPTGDPLEVAASSPTGMVFNDTDAFKITQDGVRTPARFIFTENFPSTKFPDDPEASAAQVTGWSPEPAPATTTTPGSRVKDPAFDTGLALVPANHRHGPWLLASDFASGRVDIYNSKFQKRPSRHLFIDRRALNQGLLAYNVMFLQGRVYVAYGNFGVAGSITVFDANGMLLKRLVVQDDRLVGPWGMAIAPRSWGHLRGALLVGNVESGLIVAYDKRSGQDRGVLRDERGDPIVIPGLWGLQFGNGVIGTPWTLVFAAGIGDEQGEGIYEHGLVGLIKPAMRNPMHH